MNERFSHVQFPISLLTPTNTGLHFIFRPLDTVTSQFIPLYNQLQVDANNGDLAGAASTLQKSADSYDQLIAQTDDAEERAFLESVQKTLQSQVTKINAGESSAEDLKNIVSDGTLIPKAILAWGAATGSGILNGLVQGAGGALNGAKTGLVGGLDSGNLLKGLANGVTGTLSGATNGLTNGALGAFGETLARGFSG